jgi:nondiscriminating glutamyl-tRNA synthetase
VAEARASDAVLAALAGVLASAGPLIDRESFRAAAKRVQQQTGLKGKALFHPIRLALTGEAEGLELDIAVPAIEKGAALGPSGIKPIPSAAARAAQYVAALRGLPR